MTILGDDKSSFKTFAAWVLAALLADLCIACCFHDDLALDLLSTSDPRNDAVHGRLAPYGLGYLQ